MKFKLLAILETELYGDSSLGQTNLANYSAVVLYATMRAAKNVPQINMRAKN